MKSFFFPSLVIILLLITSACSSEKNSDPVPTSSSAITNAISVISPTTHISGNKAKGIVLFEKTENGILIKASFSGLEPGNHGFHIHQYGNCSEPNGTSAGGHFNPLNNDHASPDAESRHVGELGNLTADANGNASLEYIDNTISFSGASNIIGRGIIVHAGEDDLISQPTGAAGSRVGCGVIGVAEDN